MFHSQDTLLKNPISIIIQDTLKWNVLYFNKTNLNYHQNMFHSIQGTLLKTIKNIVIQTHLLRQNKQRMNLQVMTLSTDVLQSRYKVLFRLGTMNWLIEYLSISDAKQNKICDWSWINVLSYANRDRINNGWIFELQLYQRMICNLDTKSYSD